MSRGGFAQSPLSALQRVSGDAGFVLSVEGPWGSGKTSTLAMIEQLARSSSKSQPVVVHFNPWLVGDRDSLLRKFLGAISASIKVSDNVANARKIAKELNNYSKAFDFVKWIPGAEPWASIVKSVMQSAGNAVEGAANQKELDIDQQKAKLEAELKKLKAPILVFIDDIDRLFPLEVFEMVRIIKAVGQLPNVGYIVAWDSAYVSKALESANIPQASTYLDKIVQIRLPLPAISPSARADLINDAASSLPEEAHDPHFPLQQDRLQMPYFHGLRDLLEQPRDIARTFNTVSVIEPGLRGEIAFSDIIGLAVLMTRAPAVFDLLRRNHRLFVDAEPPHNGSEQATVREQYRQRMADIFSACPNPEATKKLVHFLFPEVAKRSGQFSAGRANEVEGHIAAPNRAAIALQMSIGVNDVSLVDARNFLTAPSQRSSIVDRLGLEKASEFLEKLGDVAGTISPDATLDLEETCIAISRLADTPPFSILSDGRRIFPLPVEQTAVRAIEALVQTIDESRAPLIAKAVAQDPRSLSVASQILRNGTTGRRLSNSILLCTSSDQGPSASVFADNFIKQIRGGRIWTLSTPTYVFWTMGMEARSRCPDAYAALKQNDPTLDRFALEFLKHGQSSSSGQSYLPPEDSSITTAFVSMTEFKSHANERIASGVKYPAKAAWRSVIEESPINGRDGSPARTLR